MQIQFVTNMFFITVVTSFGRTHTLMVILVKSAKMVNSVIMDCVKVSCTNMV